MSFNKYGRWLGLLMVAMLVVAPLAAAANVTVRLHARQVQFFDACDGNSFVCEPYVFVHGVGDLDCGSSNDQGLGSCNGQSFAWNIDSDGSFTLQMNDDDGVFVHDDEINLNGVDPGEDVTINLDSGGWHQVGGTGQCLAQPWNTYCVLGIPTGANTDGSVEIKITCESGCSSGGVLF